MTKLILTTLLILTFLKTNGQVVPNLMAGDNFRPYLTEAQKRQEIFKAPQAKTSQELHPELYQDKAQENLDQMIKQGLIPNPNDAFKNQARIGFPQSSSSPSHFGQQSEENKRQIAAYEADLAAYQEQQRRSQEIIEEANKVLYTPTIKYSLGIHNSAKAERYANAYSQINDMLMGKQKTDFLKATWLVESSFDTSLSWEEFSKMFYDDIEIITLLMAKEKLSPNDNLAKLMAIYKFMSDTTTVYLKSKERNITSKPMLYDFEDYAGKKDPSKVFVSKLLRTGTGQCMSLPMLFYLYAKALGAEAYIAFAPEHTYIMFKDHPGNWQNTELTGRIFTTNDFYWLSGFIKSEQRRSGIYLRPISEKETLAYLVTTLAITYTRTFGADDRILDMALTAKEHSPMSLTANMLVAGYGNELWKNIVRQYSVYNLNDTQLANDKNAQAIKKQKEASYDYLTKNLGYSKVPEWAYKQWLDGVNSLANKQKHIVKKRELEHQLNK